MTTPPAPPTPTSPQAPTSTNETGTGWLYTPSTYIAAPGDTITITFWCRFVGQTSDEGYARITLADSPAVPWDIDVTILLDTEGRGTATLPIPTDAPVDRKMRISFGCVEDEDQVIGIEARPFTITNDIPTPTTAEPATTTTVATATTPSSDTTGLLLPAIGTAAIAIAILTTLALRRRRTKTATP